MARCLPFPPPGFMRNGACGEALIESIKLQREILESKKGQKSEKKELKKNNEKKGKRREEKEKKKEKRQKEGVSKHANGGKGKDFEQFYQPEKSRHESGSGCLRNVDNEEHLERSGITEEHDQPLSPPELSECNQSCNKRKRSCSPSSHHQCTASGTVIKIRLPSKRRNEPHESHHGDKLVSTSGTGETTDCITHVIKGGAVQLSNYNSSHPKEFHVINGGAVQLPKFNSLHPKESRSSSQQGACYAPNLVMDKGKKKEDSSYSSLFQNWVPLPLKFDEIDDQGWLFKSKLPEDRLVSKRVKSVDVSQSSTRATWPSRAQWLPEAEIYSLPYTVPF